jgi:hypothetical protein
MFENEHKFYLLICHIWSINQSDLDLSVTDWKRLLHKDGPLSDLIFVPQYVIVVGLHFKWYTLYLCNTDHMYIQLKAENLVREIIWPSVSLSSGL